MLKKYFCLIASSILLVALLGSSCVEKYNQSLISWTQAYPGKRLSFRAITTGKCPNIVIDGTNIPMEIRAKPKDGFPETVCEIVLPDTIKEASIGSTRLPTLFTNERGNVAVIGDTGCRVSHDVIQDCKNDWPWAAIANEVVAESPKLIIHTGDYIYREAECPDYALTCQGAPFGDNFDTWKAEFFADSNKLRQTAPFIFIRGNHEACKRAGIGFMRYFASERPTDSCPKTMPAENLEVAGVKYLLIDTSWLKFGGVTGDAYQEVADYIATVAGTFDKNISDVLLSHKPMVSSLTDFKGRKILSLNPNLYRAVTESSLKNVPLVISGHVHNFQHLNSETFPRQIIVGNSGTSLYFMSEVVLSEEVVSALSYTFMDYRNEYGYGMLTLGDNNKPNGFAAVLHPSREYRYVPFD